MSWGFALLVTVFAVALGALCAEPRGAAPAGVVVGVMSGFPSWLVSREELDPDRLGGLIGVGGVVLMAGAAVQAGRRRGEVTAPEQDRWSP